MDKAKTIKKIDRALDDRQPVKVYVPREFLAKIGENITLLENNLSKADSERRAELLEVTEKFLEIQRQTIGAIAENRVDKVEVTNIPASPEIKIPSQPKVIGVEKPKWWKPFDFTKLFDKLDEQKQASKDDLRETLDHYKKIENAFAVRLVDKEGKEFYKAVGLAIAGGIGNQPLTIGAALPAGSNTIGNINLNPLGVLGNGQKTVTTAGTAEVLAASTAIDSVTVKALLGNTNNVYVGDSSVDSTNGFELDAGESISLDVDNLADVYIDADTNGEGVSFIYLT